MPGPDSTPPVADVGELTGPRTGEQVAEQDGPGVPPESGELTPSLAERIDLLFRTVRPPDRPGREYTPSEVAAAISAAATSAEGAISDTYVRYLRTGQRSNPTKRHLEALASFFGVSPTYFFDQAEARAIHAQLALLAAMRDERVQVVALRAAGLSDRALGAIAEMIEHARVLEGLEGPRNPGDGP